MWRTRKLHDPITSVSAPDVALVAPYPPGGQRHAGSSGVASYTANLAHALTDAGADVTVVAPVEADEPSVMRDGDVRVERSFPLGPRSLPAAASAASRTGAPVVHVQFELFLYGGPGAVPGLAPALARLRRGRRPVVTLHQVVDPRDVDRAYTERHRVRAPVRAARWGVAGLHGAVRRLAAATIVHEDRFASIVDGARVVPHGIERRPSLDRDAARRSLGLDERLTVLCFGFVAPYKGLEAALEAGRLAPHDVQVVVAGGPHPRLHGRDPYAERLKERWGSTARFTGWVPEVDVAAWFSAADVALFPYLQPFSSSGALALALAYGTPVLMSEELADCTGAPPALATSTEPTALARRLTELARDPAARTALTSDARGLAEGRSWPAVAQRHLEVYEEVVDGERPAHRRLPR